VTVDDSSLNLRRLLPIIAVVLVDMLGMTIIIPLLPLYATAFGADPFTVGMLGASYPALQFVGAPILGRLSDRIGRRPVLIASQIGTFLGFLLLGVAHSLPLLFLSRIIDGFSGGNISTAQAMISDLTTPASRTRGMGLIGAAFGVGFVIGPVIAFASLLVSGENFHGPALIAAGFSALSILLSIFWLKEPDNGCRIPSARSAFSLGAVVEALRRPEVGFLLMLIFAQQTAFGGFQQFLALFSLHRLGLNASGNAIVFVFVGIIVVAVQGGMIGRLSRRFGDHRLVVGGLMLLALAMALTALTPHVPVPWYERAAVEAELAGGHLLPGRTPPTHALATTLPDETVRGWSGLTILLLAMLPAAAGGGLLQPALNSLISQRSGDDERGGMLGVSAGLLSGGNAIAPLIGGIFFQWFGPSAPFWFWAAFTALLAFWARSKLLHP
jgi:DHA1 family tetracycline resistance protein-like MFS transporter